MDRDIAFIIYMAAMVAVVNVGLLSSGVANLGPYLGLYSLAYVTGAFFTKPRRPMAVWSIAGTLVVAFLAYSAIELAGWLR